MIKCLPSYAAEELKKALKDKDIKISDLLNLDHDKLSAKLEPYVGKSSEDVATMIEEKLILKNRLLGLKNVISKLTQSGKYSPEAIAQAKEDLSNYRAKQQERIFSPKEHESYLGGVADKIMGFHISRDVANKIFDLSSKADALKNPDDTFGASKEYIKAQDELNSYVESQKPTTIAKSLLKDLTVIGRNNLLMNPSIPIKATAGQVTNTIMDNISRRLGSMSLGGPNSELTKQLYKQAQDFSNITGRNPLAMESLDDSHMLGKGESFNIPGGHTTGGKVAKAVLKGVGKVAEVSNTIAIKWEHQVMFNKFYQKAFLDMANLASSDMAKLEGLSGAEHKTRSAELIKDAVKIEPKTPEGEALRKICQQQAARITATNETWVSRLSLRAKNSLNKVIPNLPLGDLIVPIAKIPANVIANGLENAGGGLPWALKDAWQGRVKMNSEDMETRYEGMSQFHKGIQSLMRIGGTMAVSALIASQFKKEDFMTDKFGKHFVKIGDRWISTDYISLISPALAGFMMAKGMDGNLAEKALGYVAGASRVLQEAPGIDEANKLIHSITGSNMVKGIQKYMTQFATSRAIPSAVNNVAFKDRKVNRLLAGATGARTDEDIWNDKYNAYLRKSQ